MEKLSKEIKIKAKYLLEKNKVKKELETDKRIHFTVKGDTETHDVIFEKEKKEWKCDCKWSTLTRKKCSHILSAQYLND